MNSTHGGIFPVNPTALVNWFEATHKMWSCSFWTQSQKVVGYHSETTTSVRKSPRENLPPRNTPDSFCRLLHPTKSSLCCVGGIFLLWVTHLESFMSRLNVIPCHDLTLSVSEPENAAVQTGAGTSFGANGDQHTQAAKLSTYFCVLIIRKHFRNAATC